jgi:hypothetical protein
MTINKSDQQFPAIIKFFQKNQCSYLQSYIGEYRHLNTMVKIVVALILLLFASYSQSLWRVKSYKCTASKKTVDRNFKCFAKSYSRSHSTLNFYLIINRPVFHAKVRVKETLKDSIDFAFQ